MAVNLMTSDFNIIFLILSLLPTETIIRVKRVCRAWARVISHPTFIKNHCSRPAPISTLFMPRPGDFNLNECDFIAIRQGYRFPSSIACIMSTGFVIIGHSSHGILCFSRNMMFPRAYLVFFVGNPVTSSWCFVRYDPPYGPFYDAEVRHKTTNLVLTYDPAISHYFKLVISSELTDIEGNRYIQFHIYYSETSCWTVSSRFDDNLQRIWDIPLQTCKIGGGSVCWIEQPGVLVGYEISTDTCWKTTLPLRSRGLKSLNISSQDNIIYCTIIHDFIATVCRLEAKDNWVFEGACINQQLARIKSRPYAYDVARRALLIGDETNDNLLALHLPTSTLEILCQGFQMPMPPWTSTPVTHSNTLAPLHDADKGIDGFAREFGARAT